MHSVTYFIISFICSSSDSTVLLNFNGSAVVGKKLSTVIENKPYAAFWKIPYAVPPIRELRFKPPKRYQLSPHNITYDFSKSFNETCASGVNEDCLYLSLYMPITDNKTNKFSVVVWIHEQSNFHGPDFFIDEEVIVLMVSYRTSILGFLNTKDDFAEGNMGAKDIVLALKWVREYIRLFSGDSSKVTVAGSGLSANLVASLLLSTTANELFARVIIQSGSGLSPADYRKNSFKVLNKLYCKLNGHYKKFDRTRLYELLSNATINEFRALSEDLFDSTEVRDDQRLTNPFGPTVEASNKHAFMNNFPLEVYKTNKASNNVEVMMGYTNLESFHKLKGFVKNKKLLKYLNYNFQYLLPFEGKPDEYDSKRYREIRREIMAFYFDNGTIGERSLRRYAKYVSDQVVYPLLRQAIIHAAASSNNVYLYRFAFKGALNVALDSSTRNLNYSGATAGDEICYLFKCKSVNDVYRSAEAKNERQFIKKIGRLWTNFVKCGNPTPAVKDALLGSSQWKPLELHQSLMGMGLDKTMKMRNLPEEKRIKFWEKLRKKFFSDKVRFYEEL